MWHGVSQSKTVLVPFSKRRKYERKVTSISTKTSGFAEESLQKPLIWKQKWPTDPTKWVLKLWSSVPLWSSLGLQAIPKATDQKTSGNSDVCVRSKQNKGFAVRSDISVIIDEVPPKLKFKNLFRSLSATRLSKLTIIYMRLGYPDLKVALVI